MIFVPRRNHAVPCNTDPKALESTQGNDKQSKGSKFTRITHKICLVFFFTNVAKSTACQFFKIKYFGYKIKDLKADAKPVSQRLDNSSDEVLSRDCI